MNARIAAIRSAETARRRCRPLADEIRGLAWEKVDRCELCGNQHIAVIATTDRYGMAIRSGLCLSCGTVFLLDRLNCDGYADFYRRWYCYYFSQEVASALFPSLGWKIVNIDITVKPNHVGYLLQRVDVAEPMPQMCQFDRLKRLQLLQNAWRLANECDNDLRRVLLRQAYRLKKGLVRLSGGRQDAVH